VLRIAENDLGDPDFSGFTDCFADEGVGAVRSLAGLQVVRGLVVPLVHLLGIDEVENVDGLGLLDRGGLEIVAGEHDELPFLVLEPLDQVFPGDRLPIRLTDPLVMDRRLVLRM
jgi:hypothetical protein